MPLFYRSALNIDSELVQPVIQAVADARRGRKHRRTEPNQQTVMVLAYLRHGHTLRELGAAYGVSHTTVARYITEVLDVCVAHVPTLTEALRTTDVTLNTVFVDGTVFRTQRYIAHDKSPKRVDSKGFYSNKHGCAGMNI